MSWNPFDFDRPHGPGIAIPEKPTYEPDPASRPVDLAFLEALRGMRRAGCALSDEQRAVLETHDPK